ncbi:MAG: molecular chaperone DnaK [Candidatus Aminicenantes bacterium]|nr:molecular chaperone DnaK [Candidatus Aminicenantes bacterium]
MGKVIGIDLGTTNSVVAVYESKNPGIILTQDGDRTLPSVVAFTQNEERLVGNPAKSQLITNPENTVYSVKRLMGKRFSELEPFLDQFSYSIVKGPKDTLKIKTKDKLFSPEEISAMILEKLKEASELYLGSRVESAIITVPAYFNDSQRKATRDAGEIAGLQVTRIINEPTAAALAFSLDLKKKSKIVVYDFGGGTIDVSFLEVDKEIIKVIATAGNSNLGGNDIDILLSNLLISEFKDEYGTDLSKNKLAVQRIRDAAEIAKKELSSLDACEINLPFMADSSEGPIHLLRYISRTEFENLILEKIEETIEIMEFLLNNANIEKSDIQEILMVGGSTRIPLVQAKVNNFFKKEPNKKINPDEIVALGAAMQGAITKGETKDMLLLDVTPLSLGVKTYGGSFSRIVEANTTIPTDRSLVFSTVEDNQSEVEINVYQGEREIAEENKLLGKFSLRGINPAPKGLPRIEVNFNININGILTVTAIDLSSKHKKEVAISNSGLLSKSEITELKKEGEKYKRADLERKEAISKKASIYNHIYSIDQFISNMKLEPEIQDECKNALDEAHRVIEKEKTEEMDETIKKLQEMNNRLTSLYKTVIENIPQKEIKPVEDEKSSDSTKKVETRPLQYLKEKKKEVEEPNLKKPDTNPIQSTKNK